MLSPSGSLTASAEMTMISLKKRRGKCAMVIPSDTDDM